MFKYCVIIICFLSVLSACTQDDCMRCDREEIKVSAKISIDEALQNAEDLFGILEGNTRSKDRTVSSIQSFNGKTSTRSNEEGDALYYLVNYGEDDGFAVLSANSNIGTVLAIGEEGHLDMEDTVENKVLANFFHGLDELNTTLGVNDSIIVKPPFPSLEDSIIYKPIVIVKEKIEPRLAKSVQYWPGDKGTVLYGRYPASTVSVAQAMTYFQRPLVWQAFNYPHVSKVLNWPVINSYEFSNTSSISDQGLKEIDKFLSLVNDDFQYEERFAFDLMLQLGEWFKYDIDQIWGPSMSITGPSQYYQEPNSPEAAEWIKKLKEDKIIIAGNFTNQNEDVESMTWVVDGYITYVGALNGVFCEYNTDTMFHCVWGKGHGCNGYFVLDCTHAWNQEIVPDPVRMDEGGEWQISPDAINGSWYYAIKSQN